MERLESHVFSARYDYGPQEEQLKRKNCINRFFKDIITRLFKPMIYGAADSFVGRMFHLSKDLDLDRLKKAKDALKFVGGEPVKIKTADGEFLDGMHLNANRFKETLEKYFNLIEEMNDDGTISQRMVLKEEFSVLEKKELNGKEYNYMNFKREIESEMYNIMSIVHVTRNGLLKKNPEIRGLVIDLGIAPNDTVENRSLDELNPTAILVPGSGMPYAAYKGFVASYLLQGMDVMLFDPRGYGESEGSPTDDKTKLDLDAVYQYVHQQRHIDNTNILIHGHCLGAGAASDLASRRAGVNLLLDRTFPNWSDLAAERFSRISSILRRILPWIVNYNNAENLEKITGHIALVRDVDDAVIPDNHSQKLVDHLPQTNPAQVIKVITSNVGHSGNWSESDLTKPQYEAFLEQSHLRRRLF